MKNAMKLRFLALFACGMVFMMMPSSGDKGLDPLPAHDIQIVARPVNLNESDPKVTRIGSLTFLGGWSLESRDLAFGGLSALLAKDGVFTAVGDTGTRVDFAFDGHSVRGGHIKPLPTGCGRRWLKRNQDSESIAVNPATGVTVLGLEMRQSLCILPSRAADQAVEVYPPEMRRWPHTGGAESSAFLKDGRLLVMAERDDDSARPVTPAVLFSTVTARGVSAAFTMGYEAPAGFRAVDAVELKDGRLLVLNRSYTFPVSFRSSLVLIEKPNYAPGFVLKGREIARFEPPFITDNLEGLAVEEKSEGTTIWLTSDNNFWPLQRTLLLKFHLGNERP